MEDWKENGNGDHSSVKCEMEVDNDNDVNVQSDDVENFISDLVKDTIKKAMGRKEIMIEKILNEVLNSVFEKQKVNCNQCTKTFSNNKSYKVHFKHKHDASVKFYCSDCNNFFKSKSEYLAHRMVTHEKVTRKKVFKMGKNLAEQLLIEEQPKMPKNLKK